MENHKGKKKEPCSKARVLRPESAGKARALKDYSSIDPHFFKPAALPPGELMIGDLVWSELTARYVKVVALDEGSATVGTISRAFMVPADDVRAVKITGEVLTAMGLKESGFAEGPYYTEAPVAVAVEMFHDGKWLVNIYDDEKAQTMEGLEVRYVHELQHALRVMGVETRVAGEPRHAAGELCEVLNQNY
jgi:hypothetical protein